MDLQGRRILRAEFEALVALVSAGAGMTGQEARAMILRKHGAVERCFTMRVPAANLENNALLKPTGSVVKGFDDSELVECQVLKRLDLCNMNELEALIDGALFEAERLGVNIVQEEVVPVYLSMVSAPHGRIEDDIGT